EELYVHGQAALLLQESCYGLDMSEQLAFVIRSPPADNIVAFDSRPEGWRIPFIQRIDGCHVIVSIEEDRGQCGVGYIFSIYNRVCRGRQDLYPLHTYFIQVASQPA